VQKTYYPKPDDVTRDWYVVDAAGENLGRLASRIAQVLIGKSKCEKVTVTGKKLDQKIYYRHSGYPGGLKAITLRNQLEKFPDRVITSAVWGMIPHNRYGRKLMTKLKVYRGTDHPHSAQKPKKLKFE